MMMEDTTEEVNAAEDGVQGQESASEADTSTGTEDSDDGDKFPRSYVEQLRTESKGHRERATAAEARAEELARELFTARVRANGKLADETDLAFDESLTDAELIDAAIETLLSQKPHLKARNTFKPIGQGVKGEQSEQFSLLNTLKGRV